MPEYRFFHISNNGKLSASGSLVEAILAANIGGYIWVDFYQPSPDEIKQLRDPLGLNPVALTGWETPDQAARMQHYPRNTYLCVPFLRHAEGLSLNSLHCFVGEKFLLTLSAQNSDNLSPLTNFTPPESVASGPAYLLQAVLTHLSDQSSACLETLTGAAAQAEQLALSAPLQLDMPAAVKARQELHAAARRLPLQQAVLERVVRKESPFIPEQAAGLFQSLHDRTASLRVIAEDSAESLTGAVDLHLSAALRKNAETARTAKADLQRITLAVMVILPVILLLGTYALTMWTGEDGIFGKFAFIFVVAGAALAGQMLSRLLGLPGGKR